MCVCLVCWHRAIRKFAIRNSPSLRHASEFHMFGGPLTQARLGKYTLENSTGDNFRSRASLFSNPGSDECPWLLSGRIVYLSLETMACSRFSYTSHERNDHHSCFFSPDSSFLWRSTTKLLRNLPPHSTPFGLVAAKWCIGRSLGQLLSKLGRASLPYVDLGTSPAMHPALFRILDSP